MTTIPDCQGEAFFDSEEQAKYVADEASAEFDSVFVAMKCASCGCWHVREA